MGKNQQLSQASIITMRDQIDNFKLQLAVEGSNLIQHEFDLEHILEVIQIKKRQTIKKIETLNSNITVLEKEIKTAYRTGKHKMPENEETTEEKSSEETKEEAPETEAKEEAPEESSEEESSDEESSEESSE